jgi:hypothetical protein
MKDVKATEEAFTHPKKSKKAPENMKFILFFFCLGDPGSVPESMQIRIDNTFYNYQELEELRRRFRTDKEDLIIQRTKIDQMSVYIFLLQLRANTECTCRIGMSLHVWVKAGNIYFSTFFQSSVQL